MPQPVWERPCSGVAEVRRRLRSSAYPACPQRSHSAAPVGHRKQVLYLFRKAVVPIVLKTHCVVQSP